MSLIIPFANALQLPTSDRSEAGGLHSTLPMLQPVAATSTAVSAANSGLLFGDNASGQIAWKDISTDANSQTAGDTPIFNSDGDKYYIPFTTGDQIESLDWYVSTAGAYAGSVMANLAYYNAAGTLVTLAPIAAPTFSSIGVKRLMLPAVINFADVGEMNDPQDGTAAKRRYLMLRWSGITAVTTAPMASLFWKRKVVGANPTITDFTPLLNLVDKTPFNALNTLALAGDLTLSGLGSKFAALFPTFTRARVAGLNTELVYSKGGGVFGVFPAADISIASGSAGNDELWQGTPGSYVDILMPQSDWAKDTITIGNTAHNLYWLGWRTVVDAGLPTLVPLITLHFASLTDTAATGIRADETAVYTNLEFFSRETSADETWVAIANKRTEQVVFAKLPANAETSLTAINFPVVEGDTVVVQVTRGGQFFNVADGFVRLSK